MKISTLISRAVTLAQLLENPKRMKLYRMGGMVPVYAALDAAWFHRLHIRTVLDIGANAGGCSLSMAELLPKATIYAFEPLEDIYQLLCRNVAPYAGRIKTLNCALGETEQSQEFLRYGCTGSSSFLKPSSSFQADDPNASQTEKLIVKTRRLDDVAIELALETPMFVKMDVQGFEDRVMRGGGLTLAKASVIMIESSFVPQYQNQAMFDDVYKTLTAWGFRYFGSMDVQLNKEGLPAWEDALFIKPQ